MSNSERRTGEAVVIFHALRHDKRLKILARLYDNLPEKTPYEEIKTELELDDSACSHHLKVLRDAGLIQRDGAEWKYSPTDLTINLVKQYSTD